jgi:hypothetical protein
MLLQSETFQEDIYPDTLSGEPSLEADDWFSGKDAPLSLLKMESVYQFGSGGQPSRQKQFTPLHQSQPETKAAPSLEQKASVQSESTPKAASTSMPIAPEKLVSSFTRTPSEPKNPAVSDVQKDVEMQKPATIEAQPMPKDIEKAAKSDIAAVETERDSQSGSGPTVFTRPSNALTLIY